MAEAVLHLQKAVCAQVAQGVVDTLGISAWPAPDAEGAWVQLPPNTDIAQVAHAITLEGAVAEPAQDAPYLLLPVQPWFSAEEIDHTILCCAKVCHVMLGIHPAGIDLATHLAEGAACHWPPSR